MEEYNNTIFAQYIWPNDEELNLVFTGYEFKSIGSIGYDDDSGFWFGSTIKIDFMEENFQNIINLMFELMLYNPEGYANSKIDFILFDRDDKPLMYCLEFDDSEKNPVLINENDPNFNANKKSLDLLKELAGDYFDIF